MICADRFEMCPMQILIDRETSAVGSGCRQGRKIQVDVEKAARGTNMPVHIFIAWIQIPARTHLRSVAIVVTREGHARVVQRQQPFASYAYIVGTKLLCSVK